MNAAITFIRILLKALVGFALRWPGPVVAGAFIISAASIYYTAANFSIHTDTDEMIDSDLPFRQAYTEFNRTFPELADSFIAVIDGASPEAAEAAQRDLANALRESPELYKSVYAPGLGPYFEQNGLLLLDYDELVTLSDDLAGAEPVLASISEDQSLRGLFDILTTAMEEIRDGETPSEKLPPVLDALTETATRSAHAGERAPLSWQAIFMDEADAENAKRRLVLVQPQLDFTAIQAAKVPLRNARALAGQVMAGNPGVDIRYTGKIALNADELKSVTDGALLSGIVSLVLVSLVLGFGIRSGRMVAAALITLLIGLSWTAGFAIFAIGYLNIISIAFAVLFIGLGIDFAIHFVLRYQEEAKRRVTPEAALRRTALAVGQPLAICAPTTALAFFAFVPTSYAGLAQLGLISGTGMFISFITSLTLLPALLKLMPFKPKPLKPDPHAEEEAHFIERHGRNVAFAGLTLGAIALALSFQVRFDFDPVNLKDNDTESVQAFFDLVADETTSPYQIQVLTSGREQAAREAERLKGLEVVDKVVTLESFVPEDQQAKLEVIDATSIFMLPVFLNRGMSAPPQDEENAAAIREFRASVVGLAGTRPDLKATHAAQRLSAVLSGFDASGRAGEVRRTQLAMNLFHWFPRLLDRLETGFDARPVALADVPQEIVSRYVASDGRWRLEVYPAEDLASAAALERFVSDVTAAEPGATGSPVQIYNAGRVVKESMRQATTTAAVVILVFLYLLVRSGRMVGLITLPVFLAMALTAGTMVVVGLPFNYANVIVLPLLIGLGVDGGVHLVMRSRERKGASVLKTSTPKAVVLSALTTFGSFGSLALSSHSGTASMGILLTISIVMILLTTLLVLPGLMVWLADRRKNAKGRK